MSEVRRSRGGKRYVAAAREPGVGLDALQREEMHDRIRVAISRGMSDNDAALYAGCAARTVFRYRQARGIPPQYGGGQ